MKAGQIESKGFEDALNKLPSSRGSQIITVPGLSLL